MKAQRTPNGQNSAASGSTLSDLKLHESTIVTTEDPEKKKTYRAISETHGKCMHRKDGSLVNKWS